MQRLFLAARSAALTAALVAVSVPALADEDDVPMDPRVVEPGFKLLGVLLLAAIALFVWYHLRKRAILRAGRDGSDATHKMR